MPRDLDFYMANPESFDGLGEDDRARLFAGESLEGDTEAKPADADALTGDGSLEGSEPPGADAAPNDDQDTGKEVSTEAEPVILTKDGKHTIPFEELATARDRATQLERENAELSARLAAQQQTTQERPAETAPVVEPAAATVDIDALEEQHFEATLEGDKEKAMMLRKQINAEIERRAVERVSTENAAEAAANSAQKVFSETVAKALVDYPFLDANSDGRNADAINDVREWRDYRIAQGDQPHEALAKAVAKFGPIYAPKSNSPETTAPQASKGLSAAQKAAQAIANAKVKVPSSLSDIPAGTAAHHDEAGAMLEMGSNDLMSKFAGKTPEQIEALMAKVI